jgi:hypothetical protein
MARIKALEARGRKWDGLMDNIHTKMNTILGGIVVALVILIINLVVGLNG